MSAKWVLPSEEWVLHGDQSLRMRGKRGILADQLAELQPSRPDYPHGHLHFKSQRSGLSDILNSAARCF